MTGVEDMKYGYTLSAVALEGTAPKEKGQPLPLSNATLGDSGALGLIEECCRELRGNGEGDRFGRYVEVTGVERHGKYLLIKVKGGAYGEEFEIIDTENGSSNGSVSSNDALTWVSRIAWFFPPDDEYQAIIAAEARSGNSHLTALLAILGRKLRDRSLRAVATHELADEVAWRELFKERNSHVTDLEFTVKNPAGDGTGFVEDSSVTTVKVSMKFEIGGSADKKAYEVITGKRPDTGKHLVEAIGGTRYEDVEIDAPTATVVTDGKKRRYRVDHSRSRFTRVIESLDQVDDPTFIGEVTGPVRSTFQAYDVSLPTDEQVYPLPNTK